MEPLLTTKEAKTLQMTETNLATITKKVNRVIYAEWAFPGAMGCAGTTRVYIMDGEDLIQYETGMGELYDKIYDLINDRSDKKYTKETVFGSLSSSKDSLKVKKDLPQYFKSAYGGFGNLAWKNKGVKFSWDDKNNSFIFFDINNGRYYRVRCSIMGVYRHLRSQFASSCSHVL